ncbi:uncharacterized protein [Misgurnus anguillicaudatus]|uniref:uncharacterized protein isoform X2 n=1 Tax=Misgurnus anguillicaudatus TaxID=75329 RepID=UPI003CCF7C1E
MNNKKSSAGQCRNVTPMRATSSIDIRTYVPKVSRSVRRGRQRSKCNVFGFIKDRVVKTGRRNLNGQSSSGSRGGHCKTLMTASASKDSSQETTSITMPSGVSSFLLDCLETDSSTLDTDSTLSSIEEFRRADNCDEGITIVGKDGMLNGVKNSTLLDLSHAEDIALHQAPDLSSILELSLDAVKEKRKRSSSLSPVSLSPVRVLSEILASDITSGCSLEPAEKKTPVEDKREPRFSPVVEKQCFTENKKPIKCRKVMFSDIVRIRNISSHRCNTTGRHHYGVQNDKLVKRTKDVLSEVQTMSLKSSDDSSKPAKFFDFADECEREAFFQRLKQKYSFQFPAKMIISIVSQAS